MYVVVAEDFDPETHSVVGPFSSYPEAEQWKSRHCPDASIVQLADPWSWDQDNEEMEIAS